MTLCVPSLAKQTEIAATLDAAVAVMRRLEEEAERLQRLLPSLLNALLESDIPADAQNVRELVGSI